MISVFLFFVLHTVSLARDAGILYEVWHSHAAQAQAKQSPQLTTELVIQSNGNLTLGDVYRVGAASDIWNVQPALGYYCLYRARPGQAAPIPDCENITQTATRHAALLVEAGLDYIAIDVTNWPMADVGGSTDVSVLRPIEVLFEEWFLLRAAGVKTPQISVWPCSPANSTTWSYLVNTLYNNASYADLIWQFEGKKSIFVPYTGSCYDAATVALIESNSGRNDVKVIPMWALFGDGGGGPWNQGVWGFFSPCVDEKGDFTTSVVDVNSPCNQFSTMVNGSSPPALMEISASGGYMLSQCALPFASPGHFRGLTLAVLFEKVLALQPPHLFLSSFNEFIGGRQAPASGARIAFNMGLPADPQRDVVWVDTYASEFSRDIEPTVEGGNVTFVVAASCINMYQRGEQCSDAGAATQPCCTRTDKLVYANIWSLARTDGSDNLITALRGERDALVASGGWVERCSPIPNPTAFCVDTHDKDGSAGPFIIYNTSNVEHPRRDGTPFAVAALYRCFSNATAGGNSHFFSRQADCEGLAPAAENILGYVALTRGWEMLRALRRCMAPGLVYKLHSLDLPCTFPDSTAPDVLGYVR